MGKKHKSSTEDQLLFRQSVNKVTPLKTTERMKPVKAALANATKTVGLIDSNQNLLPVVDEIVSGQADISWNPGHLNAKAFRQLKQGKHSIEATLDLHGNTQQQAYVRLRSFIEESAQKNFCVVLVIHGKGRNLDNAPPLKNLVFHSLKKSNFVLALCSAQINHGGTGALYVKLRKLKM